MKSQVIVKDDRPFSTFKGQVPQFKGLKGRRTVTYRNSLYSDDLDDPELVFDNNNSFGDECIIRSSLCNKKEGRSLSTAYASRITLINANLDFLKYVISNIQQ